MSNLSETQMMPTLPSETESSGTGSKTTPTTRESKWSLQRKKFETAWNIQKIERQNQRALKLADRTQEVLLGAHPSESAKPNEDDGMIRIDSPETHNHYHETEKKGLGAVAKGVIAVALLGTVFGAGVGISTLLSRLEKKPTPVVQPGEIRDWKLGQPTVE